MSDQYSAGDDPVTRRLPLRGNPRTTTADDLWGAEDTTRDITRTSDSPFAGTALGSLPENDPADNPFDRPGLSGPPDLDDEEETGRRARTSLPVTLGLFCSIVAICAALTGQLIVLSLGLGGLGVVLSIIGLISARRRHVSGRVLAVFAILIGLAAAALAYGQHQDVAQLSWLTPKLPGRINDWLHSNVPGL